MGFKFKEVVEESIIYFYDHVLSSNEYTEDVFKELDHVYTQAPKANEYEAKNKELLEELKYLKKVNDDLVWQRDTDEEHEAKARILDRVKAFATEPPFLLANNEHEDYELYAYDQILRLIDKYESGESDAKK